METQQTNAIQTSSAPIQNKDSFCTINLAQPVQDKLQELGFQNPTEIQRQAIPILLENETKNFHGQAQTGTGKTLAFGLPLLHRIEQEERHPQGLIIAPTRELALQIVESITPFAQSLDIKVVAVYGGVSIEDQIRKLNRGAHIVIGTPGRLTDHLTRKTLDLSRLKTLVLDEADIMLDMGFREDIEKIMNFTPRDREIWLFSATVKSGIRDIISKYMPDVTSISASKTQVGASTTEQFYCPIPMHSRLDALCRFIECAPDFYGFIFCQTKMLTSEIADQLTRRGLIVGALHGDLSQAQRNNVVKKFKNREYSIVVATDVAGRGIDIQNLTHVVNYSLPEDFESYIHRTGRTGRAGKKGIAITFINRSQPRDIKTLERKFKITINPITVPTKDEIISQRLDHIATHTEQSCVTSTEGSTENNEQKLIPQKALELLEGKLQHLTDAQWKHLAQVLLYEKHLKNIFEAKKDSTFTQPKERDNDREQIDEIMFHVGLDDNISENDLRTLLQEKAGVSPEKILKVRMIRRRTFVRVLPEFIPTVISALADETLGGRRLRGAVYKDDRDRTPRRSSRPGNDRTSRTGRSGGYQRKENNGSSSEQRSSFRGARRTSGKGGNTRTSSTGTSRFGENRDRFEERTFKKSWNPEA